MTTKKTLKSPLALAKSGVNAVNHFVLFIFCSLVTTATFAADTNSGFDFTGIKTGHKSTIDNTFNQFAHVFSGGFGAAKTFAGMVGAIMILSSFWQAKKAMEPNSQTGWGKVIGLFVVGGCLVSYTFFIGISANTVSTSA